METTINTKTAGTVTIISKYLGTKKADWTGLDNWNNHRVTVFNNGKRFSFDFWASIADPEIKDNEGNIFAFYCALSDGIAASETFEDFCSNFGYDAGKAYKIYKLCGKTLAKLERVFNCDLYDLTNEIQDTYNC